MKQVRKMICLITAAMLLLAVFGAGCNNSKKGDIFRNGGVTLLYEACEEYPTNEQMDKVCKVLRFRLDSQGWKEGEIKREGANSIRVNIPGSKIDIRTAEEIVGTTAKLTFRDEDGNVLVDGSTVTSAKKGSQTNYAGNIEYTVMLKFNSRGAEDFSNATAANIGKPLYIYLDDYEISKPTVIAPITNGEAVITGVSSEEAERLAMLISSGSLPFSLEQKSAEVVPAR